MMVLRHIGPPHCMVVSRNDDEDESAAPIDLSKKHVPIEVPHRHTSNNKSPFISIVPSIRSVHNSRHNLASSQHSPEQNNNVSDRLYRGSVTGATVGAPINDVRLWREVNYMHGNDEETSYSSPDSGLQRDSPGEDDEQAHNSSTPPLRSRRQQSLIPLSLIRARYNHNHRTTSESSNNGQDEDSLNPRPCNHPPDQVKTKRARLEEMVSHIKQVKPGKSSSQRLSGDDESSSGEHVTSSDEIADESPTDLRSDVYHRAQPLGPNGGLLGVPHDLFRVHRNEDCEEPYNLAFSKIRPDSPHEEEGLNPLELLKNKIPLKNFQGLSPTEAAKMYGVDPETYQQQMMQLQLTSAAMMGDPGGLLKAIGNYPPWVYLGYYSQMLQNFQAQELIRQYAMQSQSATTQSTTASQGDKSPTVPTTLSSSGYNCRSPLSPASHFSEGPNGVDSDGSIVGQSTPGSANGKRAPRAMTGRHVRTGTGASPSTLQTLREKIEERQRLKAQQAQGGGGGQQTNSKGKTNNKDNNLNSSINNNNNTMGSNTTAKPSKKSKK